MKLFRKRPAANWWQGAFIYQVYPRSFLDTNNDGIGDLPGIIQKLDYIAGLGVDAIWISPFFPSPMKDFGYDVSDYRDVDPLFGTLEDFDALLDKAHDLKLKIIIDLVLSHTSDRHPWFHESRQSRNNPKADWYVWAEGKNGGPPNNWVSVFGGPAWTYDQTRKQYYLHNFLKEQPDLNFHNPDVQDEILDTARFWLERGVDGLRLDVVNFYFHDRELRDNPSRPPELGAATQFEGEDPYSQQAHIYDKSRPENFEFLKRLRTLINEYPGTMTVGEIGDDHPYRLAAQYTAGDQLLNTTYNPHMMTGRHKKLTIDLIRDPIEELEKQPGNGWPSWAFSNHDVVRAASRWHPDQDGFSHDPALSKMLIALLGCLRGTVFLYQGEELGLPETPLKYDDLQDPWGKNLWPKWQGRDGCRTPMPWNTATHAGFSTAKPWLPISDTHHALNAEMQEQDENSTLSFAQKFIRWRKTCEALVTGAIEFQDMEDKSVLGFIRGDKNEKIACFFNLGPSQKILPAKKLQSCLENQPGIFNGKEIALPGYGFFIGKVIS